MPSAADSSRTLIQARGLQQRMARTARELRQSAQRAAEFCEQMSTRCPQAPDSAEWHVRRKYWQLN